MKIVGLFVGLLVSVIILAGFTLLNGGYVYRVECPKVGGTTEVFWKYTILDSPVPYTYSRSGCEVYSGTRLALSAIGILELRHDDMDMNYVDHLSEHSLEVINMMKASCISEGNSEDYCTCAIEELARRLSPAEIAVVAEAVAAGAERYDDLPDSVREKARDAVAAIETDCR